MKNTSMRPLPKRLVILNALRDLLAGINENEGGTFNMAGKVYVNRLLFGADVTAQAPALSIVEAPRPDFALYGGEDNFMRADKWTLLIQGITPDDKTANSEAWPYFLEQDVELRLRRMTELRASGSPAYREHYLLGDRIASVEVAPPVIRPPEAQVSSHAFFYVPIRLGIAVEIGE